MTYIKNNHLIKVLVNNLSLYKTHFYKKSSFSHLQILGSIIYIFLHKEKCIIKLEKWVLQILKRILIGFNRYIIYKIHIKDHNKVI